MHENDRILVEVLTESYSGQLERYRVLRDTIRRLLGKLVLSRGDFSPLNECLGEKQRLLGEIEVERTRIAAYIDRWQQSKNRITPCAATDRFNNVLQEVSEALRGFLDDEAQLQRYLEGIINRPATTTVPR